MLLGSLGTGVASRTRITCDELLGNFTITTLFDEEKRHMTNMKMRITMQFSKNKNSLLPGNPQLLQLQNASCRRKEEFGQDEWATEMFHP